MRLLSALPLLLTVKTAAAVGCAIHSFTTCDDGIVHWYDPDTGEVCDPHDCGGGRAPPKTDVPGCGNYKGTDTYSPKFMPSSTTDAAGEEATDDAEASGSEALTTAAPTESGAAPEESGSGSEDGDDEGAESGDDAGSGATVMGASFGGVVAMAAVLGLF